MANYSNLIAAIQATVYNNGQNLITGSALQGVLIDMVQELGQAGAVFGGVVDRDFVPATTDSNIFYVASVPGTYSGFGQSVSVGEFAIFYFDGGDWAKATVTSAEVEVTPGSENGITLATINVGGQNYLIKAEVKDSTPTPNSTHPVESGGVSAAITAVASSTAVALALKADTTYVDNQLALKADKVAGAVNGNMAALDANGNLVDSGIASSAVGDVANKIDRVAGAGVGNVAMFDAIGGIEDSEVPADNLAQQDGYYSPMIVGAAENLVGQDVVSAQFTRRVSGGSADVGTGAALIKSIKGNTLVWNQQVLNGNFADGTTSWTAEAGRSVSVSAGVATIEITAAPSSNNGMLQTNSALSGISGHKYFISYCAKVNLQGAALKAKVQISGIGAPTTFNTLTTAWACYYEVVTATTDNALFRPNIIVTDTVTGGKIDIKDIIIFDLTKMGLGTLTAAETKALFPLNYYANVTPFLLNNKAASLVTTGFNQWDEEWEQGGINTSTGVPQPQTNVIRSKNFMPVLPNTTYYIKQSLDYSTTRRIYYYDAEKNFIEYLGVANGTNTTFSSNSAYYFKVVFNGTTYNHDICINKSDTDKNGTYEPYEKHTLALNLTGLTSGGTAIFADGMKSAGSVYDEVDGAKAIKRIGSRAYQAGDESDTSVKTDGTTTYYALTTPEEYTLDAPLSMQYEINNDGTEEITPENGSTPTTAPFSAEIQYAMNAVDTLRNLPKNYISKASMDSILTAFKTAGVITAYTLTWDATNQKYNCTITV